MSSNKQIKPPMSQDTRNNIIKWAFFIGLSLSQIVFWVFSVNTWGYNMHSIIFNYYNTSFMDFFKPFYNSLESNPYKSGITSTPFTLLIAKFLTNFAKHDVFGYDVSFMQHFAESMLVLIVVTVFAVMIFSITVFANKKGNSFFKFWFLALVLLSAPFLFMYEQGSMILITVTLTYLYIIGYDAENKIIREFAHVALAVAVALSVYPLVFIILSFKKKRVGNGLRFLLYSAVLFFIPLFAIGGVGKLGFYFDNIKAIVKTAFTDGISYRVDLISGFNLVSLCMGYGLIESNVLLMILWGIVVVILFVCAFVTKSKWRCILALSLIACTVPFYSVESQLAYLILPLIFFLDTKEERIEADFIYTVLYIIILCPLTIKDCIVNLSGNGNPELYIYSLLCTTAVSIMVFMLCIETVAAPLSGVELSKRKREYAKLQAKQKEN